MTDLFDLPSYPHDPGAKGFGHTRSTSEAAATAMRKSAPMLRRAALAAVHRLGTATPLEAVAAAGIAKEALQPRLSELIRDGLLRATGERRINPSGKSAAVLRLTDRGREELRHE